MRWLIIRIESQNVTSLSCDGASTDDPAAPTLRDHLLSGVFVTKEYASSVYREYLVPILNGRYQKVPQLNLVSSQLRSPTAHDGVPRTEFRRIRDHLANDVNTRRCSAPRMHRTHDVKTAQFLHDDLDHGPDLLVRRHICYGDVDSASLSRDLLCKTLEAWLEVIPAVDSNVKPVCGQAKSNCTTDALSSTSDESNGTENHLCVSAGVGWVVRLDRVLFNLIHILE